MASIILGSTSSVEAYRQEVSQYDPNLGTLWANAVAAGQVSDADSPDDATKAARLSAVTQKRPLDGKRECYVNTSSDPLTALQEICGANGVIDNHFAPGTGPAWVEGDYDALVSMIANKYGCSIGRPSDWVGEADVLAAEG